MGRKQIIEQYFDKSEAKKHSICYKPSEANPAMTSIYIMKSHMTMPYPKKLWVKVEIEEA